MIMNNKFCACGCGTPLVNRRPNVKFWSESHRKSYHESQFRKTEKYKFRRPFVALDGEGENCKDGSHIYTLLATGKIIGGRDIRSKAGLSTEQCLDFLLSLPRQSRSGIKPIYIWFAMDYDVNMILGDIPLKGENSIESLRENGSLNWRGYRITYLPRKIFRIGRGNRCHTSYDVWGFFQTSFEKACSDWKISLPPIIAKGKASRSGFSRWSLTRIAEYNRAELEALEQLAETLRESTLPLELPGHTWHGPAALAGAWLQKNQIKRYLKPVEDTELHDAFSRAYFGGRIDVQGYGIVNPVYHYDIVSAYPSAIRYLPDLSKLEWRKGREPACGRLYAARVSWKIPTAYWAPFPWRSKNGTIQYPLEGEGWYWKPEIESALEKYGEKHFRIHEVIQAEGDLEYPFRELIEETFRYRAQLKAEENPSHVPVKLILNSLYGKFAQTVGKAAYYSLIWAGLVTAQTRAQLASVLNDDVVCIMTDSIWSRTPLSVPISNELGGWEAQDEIELVLAEAGLYQAITLSGDTHTWQRGYDKRRPIDVRFLVEKWLNDDPTFSPTYTVSRFIGMGLASVTSYPWRHWLELERKIAAVPLVGTTKRKPAYPLGMGETNLGMERGFVRLEPLERNEQVLSYPYSKHVLDPALIEERLQDECYEDLDA